MAACPHTLDERESAGLADGMCPLCLSMEIVSLRPLARAVLVWVDAMRDPNMSGIEAGHLEDEVERLIDAFPSDLKARLRKDA